MAICSSTNSTGRDHKNYFCCFWKVISFTYSTDECVFLHRFPINKENRVDGSVYREGCSVLHVNEAQCRA